MVTPGTQPRRLLDRYELREPLGRGGMGVVWLAEDRVLQRDVAIKEVALPAGVPADEADALRARVMREARAAGRLNHPNVTTIYDVVRDEGRTWIVMEYVAAPTLTDLVQQQGALCVQRTAEIGRQVLAALEAAHAEGIVHRDVKPSNVMVGTNGRTKLADFGVAAIQGDPKITMTGSLVGSPSYMAPEQAREGRPSEATDLWGLGATLYYAVEGVAPFDRGAPIPTLTAVTHELPRPMQRAGALEPIITDLLHKDPDRRPTAAMLRQRLDEAAHGGAHSAAATTTTPLAPARPTAGVGGRTDDHAEADGHDHGYAPAQGRGTSPVPSILGVIALLAVAGWLVSGAFGSGRDPGPAEEARQDEAAGTAARSAGAAGEGDAAADRAADEPDDGLPAQEPATQDDDGPADPAPPADAQAQVPDGWSTFTIGNTGSAVAHPPDWEAIERSATATDLTDPAGGRYLRVDYTDSPRDDPVADWQRQSEAFGATHEDYTEIRIEPVDFRGHDAALWEYTYQEGGAELHAYNLAIVAGGRGYALNFQARASQWDDSQHLWEQFTASFQPAP